MRKRMLKCAMVLVTGCSFQFFGCQSEEIGQLIADSINQTAVGVSSILVSSAVNEALGITE